MSHPKFEPCNADTWPNPWPMYAALREHDPVHHVVPEHDPTQDYYVLSRHADIWATMGLTTDFWKTEFWRGIPPLVEGMQFETYDDFQNGFIRLLFGLMDPNALLTMGWKWQRGDVARNADGDLAAALGRITARMFVMPIEQDMFFPPRDCAAEQKLTPGSELRVLHSIAGHFGLFGFEQSYLDEVDANLGELLATT